MKKFNKSNNLVSRFTHKFFLTIVIPIIVLWGSYLFILNLHFINNTLSIQQTHLLNSLSTLKLSMANADYVFSSLENIPEITYYLDIYSLKSKMLYSLKKTIRSQCNSLRNSNISIDSLRIYGSKPELLYADPFYPLSDLPLNENEEEQLITSIPTDTLWYIVSTSPNSIFHLYAYKKLYAYNYEHVIGYMELGIRPEVLTSYFSQFENNTLLPNAHFAVYQDNQLLYSRSDAALLPSPEQITSLPDNTVTTDYLSGKYIHKATIPDLNLQIVLTGRLIDLPSQSNNLLPVINVLITCPLFFLLFYFFLDTRDLSRQIMDFSNYIRNSDPADLTLYQVTSQKYRQQYDELLHLICSYNDLFKENSTLISKVQKMEFLNQDAMYQALQAQIHPHFIYGTLENIRMLALQNRDKMVADMIYSLSALIRESVSISTKYVTLEDELNLAQHYLKIQKHRFGNRLNYSFQIEESLYSLKLPSFILQPILENSIIYGVSNTFHDCTLSVSAFSEKELTYIVISNTGKTISPERLAEVNNLLNGNGQLSEFQSKHNGCALYNIKERLNILYRKQARIFMTLEENSTQTTIVVRKESIYVPNINR